MKRICGRSFLRGAIFSSTLSAAVLLSVLPLRASIFNHEKMDVPEWGVQAARTRTPDHVEDAPAVVLYDEYVETIDGQGRAVERERTAVRILKPQGRENTCGVSYDVDEKINYFRAWTIAADEKRYQALEANFTDEGDTAIPIMLSTRRYRTAHPPAVDVNAVVICESEEVMAPYKEEKLWHIQADIPMVYQALELDLPPGMAHGWAWHAYKGQEPVEVAPNHFRWEVKDMPALILRDIPSHPEWSALAARMSAHWGDAAVAGRDKQWQALGLRYANLEAHRADPSPEITAKSKELIAGTTDFYGKLTRITDYIQKNVRYFVVERGIGGWQSHSAAEIYQHHYGDCKDKTTLLISMLQVAGISAYYVPVDHRRHVVDPEMPSFYGDHMITAIEVPDGIDDPRLRAVVKANNGKRYLIFDPTDERTPVGNLPSNEQGGFGILAVGAGSQVIGLPVLDPDANGTDRTGSFALAADGTLTGSVDSRHSGPEGADFRLFLKYTDENQRRKEIERSIGSSLAGVSLEDIQLVQPSELDKPLEFHYKLTAHDYAHAAGPLLLVRPRVVGSDALPFNDKPRTVPIDLIATGHWHDSYNITLPAGYAVDEMPDPVALETDFASYHSSFTAKDNVLHYERDYSVKKVELPAEKQPEFQHLEGVILSDERATVVLKKQ